MCRPAWMFPLRLQQHLTVCKGGDIRDDRDATPYWLNDGEKLDSATPLVHWPACN